MIKRLAFGCILSGLAISPALAEVYSCTEWSAPQYGEHGKLLAQIDDDALIWSNGDTRVEAAAARNEINAPIFTDQSGYLYLVSGSGRSIKIRRIPLYENGIEMTTTCNLEL